MGRDLNTEILAPASKVMDVTRLSIRIPAEDRLGTTKLKSLTVRIPGHPDIAVFGANDWKMGNGVDPIHKLEGIESFRVEMHSPVSRIVLHGTIHGVFRDA